MAEGELRMKATDLRCEHMHEPVGLNTVQPVLSWISDGNQTAYEIHAFSGNREVWNSGTVNSSTNHVRCGYQAGPKEKVIWKVRLYDEEGSAGDWSEGSYETGMTDASCWKAEWIDPEPEHDASVRMPAGCLKKTFTLDHIGEARLYITCHGLYAAFLNGKRVSDFVLAPGTDDYRRRLQVQTYRVSHLLKEGENELFVILGDGWYRGNVGIDGLNNYYGSDLALLAQLETDGQPAVITDGTWLASQNGPVRENDMQMGETYDARMETITDWHPVTVRDYGYDVLCGSDSVDIREQERFAGKLFTAPNGDLVIDFGQNLCGYTEIRIQAEAGQKIILHHGETLDENGNFTQSNFDPGERNKNGIPQKIVYICRDGLNVYKPYFSLFGFRYAKIETDADLTGAEFTAVAVYSDMKQTGSFRCGNEDVSRLFQNSLWSMRSNFCDIPTDCPTRERAGWTGDAGAFAPTGVYLADCWPVLRKWLAECRIAQTEDGRVANIAPVNNSGSMISDMLQGSAGWGDACILVPWALYEAYGDSAVLAENYEMMKGWMNYCTNRAKQTRDGNLGNPWHEYLVDQGFHFGEWLEPGVNSMETMKSIMMNGAPEVATAYYYHSAVLMQKIAEILGHPEDAENYRTIAENARNAYRYTCTDNGRISSRRQCEYVRPIAFGLLNEDEIRSAADSLDALVRDCGYHLNTGFLSTPYLLEVLADHGHTDTAYKLLLQEECPGWLYAVKHGATTIWETWDGVRADGTVHDSFNHYCYGAVSGWLFSGAAGIRLRAGKLSIAPKPDRSLGYVSAEWQSPAGLIQSGWRYEGDKLLFDIRIPIKAEIVLPDGREYNEDRGEHHYEILLQSD